jgi:hypothetical protein
MAGQDGSFKILSVTNRSALSGSYEGGVGGERLEFGDFILLLQLAYNINTPLSSSPKG